MPTVHVLKSHRIANSFRVAQVRGMFDFSAENVTHEMHADIPIEDRAWQIGLIVGPSASGKTSLAEKAWPEVGIYQPKQWIAETLLDDFPRETDTARICQMMNAVGFSSPPDWLKPFAALSNGQKFRAELARALLQSENVIFDEFTSVVDRDVAKIGSAAVSKAIRKNPRLRFIAVSCHHDIAEWLAPDWIFDCGAERFEWSCLRRPEIKLDIYASDSAAWRMFRKHHYLNSEIHRAAKCYVVEWRGIPVAFTSVIHFPHATCATFKREHRTVVLPDFQGVGIGNHTSDFIAEKYTREGWRFISTTSNPAMIHHRKWSPRWRMKHFGRVSPISASTNRCGLSPSNSRKRISASFEFIGSKSHGT